MEEKRSWCKKIQIYPVRTVLIALLAVIIVLIVLSILGYIFNLEWTGLNGYKNISTATISPPKITTTVTYQSGKTLWDWLQLLIIPAVLAVAGYIINLTISRGEQAATEQRAKSERDAAEKRAQIDRDIALDNQREARLQEYYDKMSELVFTRGLLKEDPEFEVRMIARARTLSTLHGLDANRKGTLLQFLSESYLIRADTAGIRIPFINKPILPVASPVGNIPLNGADLNGANLWKASLWGVNLAYTNLSEANLGEFNLSVPSEMQIMLGHQGSLLDHADLTGANLRKANLSHVNLRYTILRGANLSEIDLSEANLTGAIGITVEELERQAKSLKGTIMPDGSKHE